MNVKQLSPDIIGSKVEESILWSRTSFVRFHRNRMPRSRICPKNFKNP